MYPKPVHDVSPVRLAIMQWQEKWTVTMSELGKDARIADLWRTASSVGISSKDPEEPMMMRLDEIGETRELQGEGWCHTRPTRPSKDEEYRRWCMYRWR